MKTSTKLIGALALTGITTLAFAGGQFCQDRGQPQGANAPYCQQFDGKHHPKFGKSCDRHHGMKGDYKNMSPEKRQALMQLKVENRLERMTNHLNLTPDQQLQVRKILTEKQQKMFQLKQESRKQVAAVLTPEQRQLMQKGPQAGQGAQLKDGTGPHQFGVK